jgi:hypothetical protein
VDDNVSANPFRVYIWNGCSNRFVMNSFQRKQRPVYTGVIKYFPKALLEVSRVSMAGNEQHHPDKPLHWDRSKSSDELDALMRHLIDAGKIDDDGIRHSAKVAWRALANLEKELELALNS